MKHNSKISHWRADKISQTVLYGLVTIAVVVYLLFWTIGFDRPSIEHPDFNEPLLTDLLLITTAIILIGAVCLVGWSLYSTFKKRGQTQRIENNIPVRKISLSVALGTAVLLIITFLLGSTTSMQINGTVYDEHLWLKLADMFIYSTITMMAVAIGVLIIGAVRSNRSRKQRKEADQ